MCGLHFALISKAHYEPNEEFDVALVKTDDGKVFAVIRVHNFIDDRADLNEYKKSIDLLTTKKRFSGLGLTSLTNVCIRTRVGDRAVPKPQCPSVSTR